MTAPTPDLTKLRIDRDVAPIRRRRRRATDDRVQGRPAGRRREAGAGARAIEAPAWRRV